MNKFVHVVQIVYGPLFFIYGKPQNIYFVTSMEVHIIFRECFEVKL